MAQWQALSHALPAAAAQAFCYTLQKALARPSHWRSCRPAY
ncbi:hypothetical protein APV28_0534 [Comamonas testosteroni]|nr:hypothetical protein APV28_0534 [Comamonas testosteroni]